MAVTALALGYTPTKGIDYTHTVDGPADYAAVPFDIYFYDLSDNLPYYKDGTGTVLSIFAAGGGTDGNGIYDGSGSLSGATTVTMGGNSLTFNSANLYNAVRINGVNATGVGLEINNGAAWDFVVAGSSNTNISNQSFGILRGAQWAMQINTAWETAIGGNIQPVSGKTLTVGGNTQIDGTLTLPLGATNNYVLTSDASGNASWQAADGNGIYDGSGTISTPTLVTQTGTDPALSFRRSTGGSQIKFMRPDNDSVPTMTLGTTTSGMVGYIDFNLRNGYIANVGQKMIQFDSAGGAEGGRMYLGKSILIYDGYNQTGGVQHWFAPTASGQQSYINALGKNLGVGGVTAPTALLDVGASTINNASFRIRPTAATNKPATPSEGDMCFFNTTDVTITSVGFWGYENGAWVKL